MSREEQGPGPPATAPPGDHGPDPAVARLLHHAGRRPPAPPALLDDVKRVARVAWQAKVSDHRAARRRRRAGWLLAAALVAVAAGAAWWSRIGEWRAPHLPPAPVATVEAWFGVDGAAAPAGAQAVGATLGAGEALETGEGQRLAVRLAGGASLRLDRGSRVVLLAAAEIELVRGAVYLDTGAQAHGGAVAVRTPLGIATDVGTQFEVRLLAAGLRVQVREGAVELAGGRAVHRAPAGTALTLDAAGTVSRAAVPGRGLPWAWVLAAAPGFDLEGRTLRQALDWVARETGWQLRFVDPELAHLVGTIVAHGAIADLAPDQVPAVLLPSAGLSYRVLDGVLRVERAGAR